jgi:WD40 repeat protein
VRIWLLLNVLCSGAPLVGASKHTLYAWNRNTNWSIPMPPIITVPQAAFIGHTDQVFAVAYHPDGATLASGSQDKTIRLWDLSSRSERAKLTGHTDAVRSLSFGPAFTSTFAPAGKFLASGSADQTVKLWDTASLAATATLTGFPDTVLSVVFADDAGTLILATGSHTLGAPNPPIQLWRVLAVGEATLLKSFTEAPVLAVNSISTDSEFDLLASGSEGRSVDLWDVNGHITAKLHEHTAPVSSVDLSADGKILASGSDDRTAKLWDVATRTVMFTLTHTNTVNSVAFNGGAEVLATASFEQAQLWDVKTGNLLATLQHPSGTNVQSVAFGPDGKTVSTGGDDNIVRLWSAGT